MNSSPVPSLHILSFFSSGLSAEGREAYFRDANNKNVDGKKTRLYTIGSDVRIFIPRDGVE